MIVRSAMLGRNAQPLISQLQETHPKLSNKSLLLCCLLQAHYSTEEIALLLDYDSNSIPVMKNKLYKRMGFNRYEELLQYLYTL